MKKRWYKVVYEDKNLGCPTYTHLMAKNLKEVVTHFNRTHNKRFFKFVSATEQ